MVIEENVTSLNARLDDFETRFESSLSELQDISLTQPPPDLQVKAEVNNTEIESLRDDLRAVILDVDDLKKYEARIEAFEDLHRKTWYITFL